MHRYTFVLIQIVFLPVILFAAVYAAKRLWQRPAGRDFGPANAPAPSRASRAGESLLILLLGGLTWFLTASTRSTGGMLLDLDQLTPAVARANLAAAIVTGVGVVVCALIALRRTIPAVILAVTLLSAYGFTLNSGFDFLGRRAAKQQAPIEWTIDLMGTNARGADLWVNGVHLGKTPVTITIDEFLKRVPFWGAPPETVGEDVIVVPEHFPKRIVVSKLTRWIAIELPSRPARGAAPGARGPVYYAKARSGDDWGYAGGSSQSTFGDEYAYSSIGVKFPDRDRRLESLLDQVRLADYRPSADWLSAIETYGLDGWNSLRKAARDEPRMREVIDAWADSRYGTGQVKDADSAWRVLDRIRREAEANRQYTTSSVAGRAIELIAPMLDPERLATAAVEYIRTARYGGYSYKKQEDGRYEFSYPRQERRGGDGLDEQYPPGAFPVAHAVYAQSLQPDPPALIQARIAPALIRWQDKTEIAAALGGAEVEPFILRRDTYRIEPKDFRDRKYLSNYGYINKWFWLGMHLRGQAGRNFRRLHKNQLFELLEKPTIPNIWEGTLSQEPYDLLFANGWGDEYWPRFKARTAGQNQFLKIWWEYLVRMDAPPKMFAETLREAHVENSELRWALEHNGKLLEPERLRAVADAVEQAIDRDPAIIKDATDDWQRREIKKSLENFRQNDPQYEARALMAQLRGLDRKDGEYPQFAGQWLAEQKPDHPLVAMLIQAPEAALRQKAIPALEARPTPDHRAMLDRLAADADAGVRAAAQGAVTRLGQLARKNPKEFAAK